MSISLLTNTTVEFTQAGTYTYTIVEVDDGQEGVAYDDARHEVVVTVTDDGVQALLFVNPHSMEVERFMRGCGLGRPEGANEPLDHVATECELLEHLALRAVGVFVNKEIDISLCRFSTLRWQAPTHLPS